MRASTIAAPAGVYIKRPQLEAAIGRFFDPIVNVGSDYAVIVGPRGSGKSTVVRHVASQFSGVVGIRLANDSETHFDVVKAIFRSLNDPVAVDKERFSFLVRALLAWHTTL